jgi:hypothetical protein
MAWGAGNSSRKSPPGSTPYPTASSVTSSATSTCWPTRAPYSANPFTRQLDGKLRELRFYLGRQQTRITYYIATGRTIVLLTVFAKTKPRQRAEIDRARRAMQRCIDEGHVIAEENPT